MKTGTTERPDVWDKKVGSGFRLHRGSRIPLTRGSSAGNGAGRSWLLTALPRGVSQSAEPL